MGKYTSRPYRWSVSMRYEPADTTAKLRIWAVQWGKQVGDFKKVDRFAQRIVPNEWHTYILEGKLARKRTWFTCTRGRKEMAAFSSII